MKLHLEGAQGTNRIQGYGRGFVAVNGVRLASSFILTPSELLTAWPPARFEQIEREHIAQLLRPGTEIALLGTGAAQQFLSAELSAPLLERGISLDVMDTAAACRTYNILASEGRMVTAALIVARE